MIAWEVNFFSLVWPSKLLSSRKVNSQFTLFPPFRKFILRISQLCCKHCKRNSHPSVEFLPDSKQQRKKEPSTNQNEKYNFGFHAEWKKQFHEFFVRIREINGAGWIVYFRGFFYAAMSINRTYARICGVNFSFLMKNCSLTHFFVRCPSSYMLVLRWTARVKPHNIPQDIQLLFVQFWFQLTFLRLFRCVCFEDPIWKQTAAQQKDFREWKVSSVFGKC